MLYEISLRIARGSYELETVYFGNGIIQIENGIIEGIIARDYVTGSISEKRIEISTFDVDFYGSHELTTKGENDIELPGIYTLYGGMYGMYEIAELDFKGELAKNKKEKALNEIKAIKKLAEIWKTKQALVIFIRITSVCCL